MLQSEVKRRVGYNLETVQKTTDTENIYGIYSPLGTIGLARKFVWVLLCNFTNQC